MPVFQNGYTPLTYAAKDNRVIVVDKLIELGCNVNHMSKVSPALRPGKTRHAILFLLLKASQISWITYASLRVLE